MARALELAERGRGTTRPNPLVGCVLVRDGRVIGEGWHERAGGPHAEVAALASLKDPAVARGATAYVTLEPCNHQGRTPPCTEALLRAGVSRVVIAAPDPNPLVDGRGAARLREAGVEVVSGVLREDAERQNEVYRTSVRLGRPFVLYKTAMSLDGKIATRSGQSRWITGPEARGRVQEWRNELDAVVVGVNTVLLDDPLLTTRLEGGRTPIKVVFDSVARTPATAKLFEPDPAGESARVVLFVTPAAPEARVEALVERGAEVVTVPAVNGRADVTAALGELHARGITGALLEGGGNLAWSFLAARAVDRVAWFVAPKLLGGNGATPLGGLGVNRMQDALELSELEATQLGRDLLLTGRLRYDDAPADAARRERAAEAR